MLKENEANLAGSDVPEGIARSRYLVMDREKFMSLPKETLEEISTRAERARVEWEDVKKLVANLARPRPNVEALRVAIASTHRALHIDILNSCMSILEALAYQGVDGRNIQAVERAKNLLLGDPVGKCTLDYPNVIVENINPSCPLARG